MSLYYIMEFFRESDRAGKKYMTKINSKTYHFGADGSETYLDHKDKRSEERRGGKEVRCRWAGCRRKKKRTA